MGANWKYELLQESEKKLKKLAAEKKKILARIDRKTRPEQKRLHEIENEERWCHDDIKKTWPSDEENINACLY